MEEYEYYFCNYCKYNSKSMKTLDNHSKTPNHIINERANEYDADNKFLSNKVKKELINQYNTKRGIIIDITN